MIVLLFVLPVVVAATIPSRATTTTPPVAATIPSRPTTTMPPGRCWPGYVCPAKCSGAATCDGDNEGDGQQVCRDCPAWVTNYLCGRKVISSDTCDEPLARKSVTEQTSFEVCVWAFSHGGQCNRCSKKFNGNDGPGGTYNENATGFVCAAKFPLAFRTFLHQGGTNDCGSQECKFAARYVDWNLQRRLTSKPQSGLITEAKRLHCKNTVYFPPFLHAQVNNTAYDVCVWSWTAGTYCDIGTSTPMDDWHAAASNACSKYRFKNGTKVRFMSYGPGQAPTNKLTQRDIDTNECPDEDDEGKTCYEKGGGTN